MIFGGRLAAATLLLLWVLPALPAFSEAPGIVPFYGRYEGSAILDAEGGEGDGETTRRDLAVTIAPDGDRFRVEWQTATRQPDGEVKHKGYAITFDATSREGIYGSAMRTNMFGNRVPLDPLKGDPYVWCRIADGTLTVYAMLITDSGGYDLQEYERTLTKSGLRLEFTRLREGEPARRLSAVLKKVAGDPPSR